MRATRLSGCRNDREMFDAADAWRQETVEIGESPSELAPLVAHLKAGAFSIDLRPQFIRRRVLTVKRVALDSLETERVETGLEAANDRH